MLYFTALGLFSRCVCCRCAVPGGIKPYVVASSARAHSTPDLKLYPIPATGMYHVFGKSGEGVSRKNGVHRRVATGNTTGTATHVSTVIITV